MTNETEIYYKEQFIKKSRQLNEANLRIKKLEAEIKRLEDKNKDIFKSFCICREFLRDIKIINGKLPNEKFLEQYFWWNDKIKINKNH
jgi:uncharacterized protein (UPF0335 family)